MNSDVTPAVYAPRRGLALGFLLAVVINIVVIQIMAALIQERPEPERKKRFRQIVLHEQAQIPQETPEKKQERSERIQQALPIALPQLSQVANAEFSFPKNMFESLDQTDWQAEFAIDGSELGLAGIDLDQRARLKFAPDLTRYYPQSAKRKNIEGETLLELEIDAYGKVSNYTVIRSEPAGVFDKTIPKLIPRIKYEPAKSGDKSMPDVQLIKLKWTIK